MEPMPMPTRSPSAPESIRCFACLFVTTLPATTWSSGNSCFIQRTISCWKKLSPWLLSMMMASTPAATRLRTRSLSAGRVPTAAATISLFCESLVASGKSIFFCKSFRATRATRQPSAVMMGSLAFFDSISFWFAAGRSTPSGAVTRFANLVMTDPTCVVMRSFTKSVSRFVTKPSSFDPILPSAVTGKPVKPHVSRSSSSCASVVVVRMHLGSMMKPLLYCFTSNTSLTCSSTKRFVWMTPRLPCSAMAIAILLSVTVSIGLDTMGVRSAIFFEKRELSSTSSTPKVIEPGMQMRSS
mmetsp:Transcript_21962/g.58004  ORF Transcript_21962/g.58004 Transcript_21962/m.58004 type:complete len:298 (+) Transcript_21962:261-1154(+)